MPKLLKKHTYSQTNRKGTVLSNGKKEKSKAYFVNVISIFDNHSECDAFGQKKQNIISRFWASPPSPLSDG